MAGKTYLFVGGPKDGERIAVGQVHIEFPVWKGNECHKYGYRKFCIRGESQNHVIYASEGMTHDEVLRLLIDSYSVVPREEISEFIFGQDHCPQCGSDLQYHSTIGCLDPYVARCGKCRWKTRPVKLQRLI